MQDHEAFRGLRGRPVAGALGRTLIFDHSGPGNKLRALSGPTPPRSHVQFRPRPFRQATWLPGAHLQTVFGRFLRPRASVPLERVRIETPDADFLDLDLGPDPGSGRPLVLVLHGLEGSTSRPYVRLAMSEITRRGMQAVGLNFRSCSGTPNLKPRFYHSGETGDVDFVLEWLHDRFPDRPVGALGFSLGGNVLLRYLGERGNAPPSFLRAAAAVSVPFDLIEGTRRLEAAGMGRIYTHYFLRSLVRKAQAKHEILREVVDFDGVLGARTLREFDEVATAPLHGFSSASEYYREASSGPILPSIRVPTLLLHALDDPFLPPEAVPERAVDVNPWLLGSFPKTGGHVGFVEGVTPWRPGFWAEAEAARYLGVVLGADAD